MIKRAESGKNATYNIPRLSSSVLGIDKASSHRKIGLLRLDDGSWADEATDIGCDHEMIKQQAIKPRFGPQDQLRTRRACLTQLEVCSIIRAQTVISGDCVPAIVLTYFSDDCTSCCINFFVKPFTLLDTIGLSPSLIFSPRPNDYQTEPQPSTSYFSLISLLFFFLLHQF
jgi:hypothetical protein